MPLVYTPMILSTKLHNNMPTLAPEEAAELIAQACIFKPVRIANRLFIAGQVMHALLPKMVQIAINPSFHMFPNLSDSEGEKGPRKTVA